MFLFYLILKCNSVRQEAKIKCRSVINDLMLLMCHLSVTYVSLMCLLMCFTARARGDSARMPFKYTSKQNFPDYISLSSTELRRSADAILPQRSVPLAFTASKSVKLWQITQRSEIQFSAWIEEKNRTVKYSLPCLMLLYSGRTAL